MVHAVQRASSEVSHRSRNANIAANIPSSVRAGPPPAAAGARNEVDSGGGGERAEAPDRNGTERSPGSGRRGPIPRSAAWARPNPRLSAETAPGCGERRPEDKALVSRSWLAYFLCIMECIARGRVGATTGRARQSTPCED
eukprot:4978834-Prymnesium_polylepis.1